MTREIPLPPPEGKRGRDREEEVDGLTIKEVKATTAGFSPSFFEKRWEINVLPSIERGRLFFATRKSCYSRFPCVFRQVEWMPFSPFCSIDFHICSRFRHGYFLLLILMLLPRDFPPFP